MEDFPHRYWRQRFLLEDDDQVEGSEVRHRNVAPGVGVRELVIVDHKAVPVAAESVNLGRLPASPTALSMAFCNAWASSSI